MVLSNGENDNMGKLPHKIDLIFAPPPNALKRAWEILCFCVFPGVSIYIGTKGLMIFFKLMDVIPFSYNLAFVFSAFLWYLMAICYSLLGISLVGVCNKRTYVQNINFNEHFIIMFDENLNRTAIDVDACIVERDFLGLVLFDRERQIRYSFDRSFYEAHKKKSGGALETFSRYILQWRSPLPDEDFCRRCGCDFSHASIIGCIRKTFSCICSIPAESIYPDDSVRGIMAFAQEPIGMSNVFVKSLERELGFKLSGFGIPSAETVFFGIVVRKGPRTMGEWIIQIAEKIKACNPA